MAPQPDPIIATLWGIAPESAEGSVLRLLIELGAQIVGAQSGSLLVLDDDGKDLVFAMAVGDEETARVLPGQRVPVGKGITGLAAQTHEVQIGSPTYAGVKQARSKGTSTGAPSVVMAAPMLIDDELIGVITAASFDPEKRFSASDAQLYARLATVAGVVVGQHRRLAACLRPPGTPEDAPPLSRPEREQREIAEQIARLAKKHPGKLECIARLLASLNELAD